MSLEVAGDADPLAIGSIIRLPPLWLPIVTKLNPSEDLRCLEQASAGLNEDGSVMNIASAMVDRQQVLGYSSYTENMSYCSCKGVRSWSGPHYILNNVHAFEWIKVTIKTVQGLATEKGVNLAVCSSDRKRYACRIEVYGFQDNCHANKVSMITEGPEDKLMCILPGQFRNGSPSPEFSYKCRRNCNLDEDQHFELLCYKTVSLPYLQ